MTSSLIPERPLLISPTLAATIGLEETVMLHVISELLLQNSPVYRNQLRWAELDQDSLLKAMPFWSLPDIERIQHSLQEKGLIQIEALSNKPTVKRYAINQACSEALDENSVNYSTDSANVVSLRVQDQNQADKVFNSQGNGARKTLIPPDWQPSDTLYQQLHQLHNIPLEFIRQRVKIFIMYWREKGETQFSWHNIFRKRMIAEWEQDQSYKGAKELESDMNAQWLPSGDALSILEHAGVNPSFIEDAIPEFILYWRERGLVTSMWNTKFIAHIRRQWGKFTLALEHDNTPRLIADDYQPSTACYEVLAMANIDLDFARKQVKEFIMYWQERKEPYPSWNTKFLQHVKFRWANQHQSDLPLIEKITDRSWAE